METRDDHVAFLPHLQESIMDELRTTEGMIFRDEGAKKLFLDTKSFLMETFGTKWKNFDTPSFHAALDEYIGWSDSIADEELQRMKTSYRDIAERLTSVTVLYAKYLYARSNPDMNILIRKPQVTLLIKGMFTRFARMHHVRNGSFFDLDPLRQDFVIRDIFRQTLGSDCIQLMEESTDAPPVSVVDEEDEKQDEMPPLISSEIAAAETDVVSDAIALQKPEEEVAKEKQKDDDEVYPDDSISRVMERSPFYAQPSGGENVSAAVSSTSRAQSRVSEFRKPTVRRVHITDVEDEKA
jgi:hypothetical protein